MRSTVFLAAALCLAATGAYAGVTINGTTITFDDNTMQSTAAGGGGAPADHGGTGNSVSGVDSFIGGGSSNLVTDNYDTISGGQNNVAGLDDGSTQNSWATVGGGWSNTASGNLSTVGGGFGNTASGNYSTVGGGYGNTASGSESFAAGAFAVASHHNSFVWGDFNGGGSSGENTFNVHASGGIFFNGGSIHMPSDRNKKEAFSFVSAREVLDKVVEMPVSTWRFKSEDDSVRHIGPMAQDFMAAFGYGKSDKHIVSTDADGVALAAIQGLNGKVEDQAETITALRWHNAQLAARLARLENALLREREPLPTGTD